MTSNAFLWNYKGALFLTGHAFVIFVISFLLYVIYRSFHQITQSKDKRKVGPFILLLLSPVITSLLIAIGKG